jgi:FkbH-like protein
MESLKFSEILQLNKELKYKVTGQSFKVAILSNVIVNTFKEHIEYLVRLNNLNPEITIGNFDNIVQDSVSQAGNDMVIIAYELLNIIDNVNGYVEGWSQETFMQIEEKIKNELDLILLHLSKTPKVIFNLFSTLPFSTDYCKDSKLDQLAITLNEHLLRKDLKNLRCINIDRIVAEVGLKEAYDFRFYLSSKAPYTLSFFKKYVFAIEPEIRKMTGKAKKVLLLDCDNTLWKGIIGEDGLQGINMAASSSDGKPYHDVQQVVKFLAANGVILVLVSKNNLSDVEEVFHNHQDMVLKPQDIVLWKVNWADKATNIREAAKELNIGLESLVFVDDSDFEINLVKQQIPEVITLQVPNHTYNYKNAFTKFALANFNLATTEEDKNKAKQYKEQFEREQKKQQFSSTEEYIKSLEIRVHMKLNDMDNLSRLAQLTQKTNQFNLTTRRYTETEIEYFLNDNNHFVFSCGVSDKFGDSGITVMAIVKQVLGKTKKAEIDTFLMSCRVLGRNIEKAVMMEILNFLKANAFSKVTAEYLKSSKNNQVCEFYESCGFITTENNNGNKAYVLELVNFKAERPNYLTLTINQDNEYIN